MLLLCYCGTTTISFEYRCCIEKTKENILLLKAYRNSLHSIFIPLLQIQMQHKIKEKGRRRMSLGYCMQIFFLWSSLIYMYILILCSSRSKLSLLSLFDWILNGMQKLHLYRWCAMSHPHHIFKASSAAVLLLIPDWLEAFPFFLIFLCCVVPGEIYVSSGVWWGKERMNEWMNERTNR